VCSSVRFSCPNNDTAFLNTPINGGSIGTIITVFAGPEFPLGPPGNPSGPQPDGHQPAIGYPKRWSGVCDPRANQCCPLRHGASRICNHARKE
jgi:hypothetical protein